MNTVSASASSPTDESPGFIRALLRAFVISLVAFYFGLKFIYPGYFHPLAAHHTDMYMVAAFSSNNFDWATCWSYPRPVLNMIASAGGDLGFEGLIIAFTVVQLLNLALLQSLLEVYFLRRRLSVLISFIASLIAVCAPGFYISYTHDVGAVLAIFFGLLAILVIERNKENPKVDTWLGFLGLCLLSALSKESFVPALAIYGCFVTWVHWKQSKVYALIILIPLMAAGLSFIHSSSVASPFVNVAASNQEPYHISLQPESLWATSLFYIKPLMQPAFIALLLVSGLVSFFKSRLTLYLGVLLAGLSLYGPYLVLPNHKFGTYYWSPIPFLFLLLLVGTTQLSDGALPRVRLRGIACWMLIGRGATFLAVICALFTLKEFRAVNKAEIWWNLEQQDMNRNFLSGIRSVKSELSLSKSVLVLGVDAPFHPWVFPEFLATDLGFNGVWCFPSPATATVRPIKDKVAIIDLSVKRLGQFDVIVCFDKRGRLISMLSGKEVWRLDELSGIDAKEFSLLIAAPQVLNSVLSATGLTTAAANSAVGLKLFEIQCFGMAERYFLKATEDASFQDAYTYFFLGRILANKGQYAAAASCFEKAIKYDSPTQRNSFFTDELNAARMHLK